MVVSIGVGDQHRTVGVVRDCVRHASEESLHAGHTPVTDHDQIGIDLVRHRAECIASGRGNDVQRDIEPARTEFVHEGLQLRRAPGDQFGRVDAHSFAVER